MVIKNGLNRASVVVAFLILVLFTALAREHLGRFYSANVDYAHHYALVTELLEFGQRVDSKPNLGEMNFYPPGAHYMAAFVARSLGVPVFAAIGVVILIASMAMAYALRFFAQTGSEVHDRAIQFLLLIGSNLLMHEAGVSLSAMLHPSFFYSQMVGETFGLLLIVGGLSYSSSRVSQTILWVLGGLVLAWVHLLPAVRLMAFAGLAAMFLPASEDTKNDRRARGAAVLIVVFGLWVLMSKHPAYEAMKLVAAHEGVLHFSWTAAAFWGMVLPAATLIKTWRQIPQLSPKRNAVLLLYLASLALLLAQIFSLVLKAQGSLYAVLKHVFGIAGFGTLFVIALLPWTVPQGWGFLKARLKTPLVILDGLLDGVSVGVRTALAVLIFVSLTFRFGALESTEGLQRLSEYCSRVDGGCDASTIVIDPRAHYAVNYLYNISHLKGARGAEMAELAAGRWEKLISDWRSCQRAPNSSVRRLIVLGSSGSEDFKACREE